MIYLIAKMFVYLAVALAAGFGAGWLTRNLTAARREEELQRTLSETKARVPQFESLMRSRDDQMNALRDEIRQKDARIGELRDEISVQDKTLKDKDRELRNTQSRLASLDDVDDADPGHGDPRLSEVDMSGGQPLDYGSIDSKAGGADAGIEVRRLEAEVERLRRQERGLQAELAAAREGQGTSGHSAMEEALKSQVQELESRLRQTAAERDRLLKSLEQEKRKVVELERERELQNKSLLVLHQQLELARESGQQAARG